MQLAEAFGLAIASDIPLPGLRPASGERPDLAIRAGRVDAGEGLTRVWTSRFPGEVIVAADLAPNGTQHLSYGDRAVFEISPAADVVTCDITDAADAGAMRFLLDTVLWWVCLTRGLELIHASAVELPSGVYAIAGRTGGGKTSLALELMRRGHRLFSDDVVLVERDEESLVAVPGPPLMNIPFAAGDPTDVGTPLATFQDQQETWVAVNRSSSTPAPLAAIFLLDRADGLELGVRRLDATVLDLMPHVWGLPHAQESAKERFQAVSDIARAVTVYQLSANLHDTPASLAALVEDVTYRVEAR